MPLSSSGSPSASTRCNQKVCFIAGARHSGSTLLGLILGSHGDCFYCGEAGKTIFLNQPNEPLRQRVCKFCGTQPCPVWQDIDLSSSLDVYEQLSRQTQKPIVIDSTKKTDWLATQLKALESTTAQPYLIFLQRDGRAAINSRLRKFPDRSAQEVIQDWLTRIQDTQALFDQCPQPKLKLHYEELATNPDAVVQRLCEFLGIEFQPQMLRYYEQEHHLLGGNDGTQYLVSKAQSQSQTPSVIELSDQRKSYYKQHELGITLDLRWKQELPSDVETLFEAIAGEVNADLRWEG